MTAGRASDDRLAPVWKVVADGLTAGGYAGAVLLLQQGDTVLLHRAVGAAMREPLRVRMAPDTLFDLASLTKVVATLPSVLRLIDAGAVGLDQPAAEIVPELGVEGLKREITIRRLLSHCSGLPAWRPLYLRARGKAAYLAAIAAEGLVATPGDTVIYSDLGFILLGLIVERVVRRSLADYAGELFAALGMHDTRYRPAPELWARAAATERGNPTEREMAGPDAARFRHWRPEQVIRGQVHDGNAYYGLAGLSGHAGLFATAADLARYGRFWLGDGEWQGRRLISAALMAEATREQATGRGLGWVVAPAPEPAEDFAGSGLSRRAFGHTGFTGTSLWVDPARELVVVFLTNRVHPELRDDIRQIRPRLHTAIGAAIAEAEER